MRKIALSVEPGGMLEERAAGRRRRTTAEGKYAGNAAVCGARSYAAKARE